MTQTQTPTDQPIKPEEIAALKTKVAQLEAERAAEHQAMTASVRRIQDRATWARSLTLPEAEHRNGCPARAERIESFDGDRRSRIVRCQDCGGQSVHFPPVASARLEA